MSGLNANPIVHLSKQDGKGSEAEERNRRFSQVVDGDQDEPIDKLDVFDIIRHINGMYQSILHSCGRRSRTPVDTGAAQRCFVGQYPCG